MMRDLNNSTIKLKAPAKINLHLEVIGKRNDGYHELAMVMQSIDLADYIEIKKNNQNKVFLKSDCKDISLGEDNLIIKAANILKEYRNNKHLGADIFLTKNIPIGAGLAGGSTDAAAALVGLNKIWQLDLNMQEIHGLASKIGSDVPFCINGGTKLCFGRGEVLENLFINKNYALILIKDPNSLVSTSDVYKKFSEENLSSSFSSEEALLKQNELRTNWTYNTNIFKENKIRNDLQKIVYKENSSVQKAMEIFSGINNAISFSMSGSGPSCYAIFENIEIARMSYRDNIILFKENDFDVWVCNLINIGITELIK